MSGYCAVFKQMIEDNPQAITFGDLHNLDRAMVYYEYIQKDTAWFEEMIVGEGGCPKNFIVLFSAMALTLHSEHESLLALYALFFDLCESHMFKFCTQEYERFRQNTAH